MSWIWLDEKNNTDYQKNFFNVNAASEEEKSRCSYAVAVFRKEFSLDHVIKKINFRISADSTYHLFVNGEFIGIGPASPGGDFLCRREYPHHFANVFSFETDSADIEVSAEVKLLPRVLTEYSKGHGGFFCDLEFIDEEDNSYLFSTDETWFAKQLTAYCGPERFNSVLPEKDWEKPQITEDIWNLRDSGIPVVSLNKVFEKEYSVAAGMTGSYEIELDKIYGVIPCVTADGKCEINIELFELKGQETTTEKLTFGKPGSYTSFLMHSAGEAILKINNTGNDEIRVNICFIAPWYPVKNEGNFRCSDEELNKVYDVCKHTLKICRQSVHLDSTKHQEHLACTGDYNIESLMTLFCFDDMRLAESDIKKTADWIVDNNGRMFHTTYSLIWVRMIKNVFMITGNTDLLCYCEQAMDKLFSLFDTYFGVSGVIENPPDYMFVDWTVIDGYSMHHPPKALGQTVLNAFWYEAVNCASEIYDYIGKHDKAAGFREKAKNFRIAFNREFFDEEKQLYIDGKTDRYENTCEWLPRNSDRIYHSKYPDILACAYGLADNPSGLLEKVIFNDGMQDIQPYFTHYLLEAVRKTGLQSRCALKIFERWKPVVSECDKGLAEGWIAPQPDYKFDHSHAWGGTVAYNMPLFISGLEILEPGMKKISVSPDLLGLDYADITMQTQYGPVKISISGGDISIKAPDEIEYSIR